jgi:hypothetical protein
MAGGDTEIVTLSVGGKSEPTSLCRLATDIALDVAGRLPQP